MRFRVPKSLTRQTDMPTPEVTTFTECNLPNKIRVDEFGSYVFIKDEEGPSGYHEFIFAPSLTREATQTPYRSYYETEPSMFWPKVWLSNKNYRSVETDLYAIKGQYRESYQGPTRVLIEEFYAPTPFEIPLYLPMSDGAVNEEIGNEVSSGGSTYWWSFGTFVLESCLHPTFAITLPITSVTIGAVTYTTATVTVAGTYYTDWPETLVIDDRQREVLGGWIRRRVTALRPMIVLVTSPTSTSVASTTATLGGTLSLGAYAVVTSRGVVYAKTSEDANPEVGNSLASSVTLSGGTGGAFTVGVTGLTPSTAYSFKPWALTSQGVRVYGAVGTFTTTA